MLPTQPDGTILLPSSHAVRKKKQMDDKKNKETGFHRLMHWDGKKKHANNPTKLGWYFFYHPSVSEDWDEQSQPLDTGLHLTLRQGVTHIISISLSKYTHFT